MALERERRAVGFELEDEQRRVAAAAAAAADTAAPLEGLGFGALGLGELIERPVEQLETVKTEIVARPSVALMGVSMLGSSSSFSRAPLARD